MTRDEVIATIERAFAPVERPADVFLQGSREGSEPFDEVTPFFGKDWRDLDAAFLDERYSALSFFSEGGFRYFLPAYLIADLREELHTADPVHHLASGFSTHTVDVPAGAETFSRSFGGSTLMNPRRYGAMTSRDYALFRLSIFAREEAAAVLAYLEYKIASDEAAFDRSDIIAAIDDFWRARAKSAPTHAELRAHVEAEQRFVDALTRRSEGRPPS
jgi:hypothetical protein